MRLSLALVLASLLASCTLLSACAASDGVADASSSFRLPISGGKPDNVDSNVFLLLSERGPAGTALCTASLIAPNLLLTARHCVSEVTEERVNCGEDTASAPLPASTLFALNAASADEADVGFLSWRQHGDVILMSAELELAAWTTDGTKLWRTFVEPPWSYAMVDDDVHLDVMGERTRFHKRTGP